MMIIKKNFPLLVIVLFPFIFAITLPLFFRLEMFTDPAQTVSVLAMIILPFTEGLLLIGTSRASKISRVSYRMFMPWLPVLFFFFITFVFRLEDCACWIIGLPVYLFFASMGGITAAFFRLRKHKLIIEDGSATH